MTRSKPPKYRRHSQSDFAFVEIDGERVRLPGTHGSPESLSAYQSLVARRFSQLAPRQLQTVAEVCSRYLIYAKAFYGDAPRGTYRSIQRTVKLLINRRPDGFGLGHESLEDFGPRRLKEWREWLIEKGYARETINKHVSIIKKAWKWAVSDELIDESRWRALTAVEGLPKGRSEAAEPPPRQPVTWGQVEAVLAELPLIPATMLYTQWLTGARSSSLCQATPAQFKADGPLLLWSPRHKTEYLGREITIPVGPVGRMVLTPFLDRDANAYLFNPREGRRGSNRRYNDRYQPWTYRRCLVRVQERLQIEPWTPHQLRHARGHYIRSRFGIEAAQACLGHDSLDATEVYSSRRLELAKEVVSACG